MRIALLHYTCPPVPGGVERVLADHARLFAAHGHAVTVLCGEGDAMGDPRIDLQILPGLRRAGPASLAGEERLRKLLATQEIVFLHNVMTMPFHLELTAVLGRFIGELVGTRFVAWVHDVALPTGAHPALEYVAVSELRRRELCAATGLPEARCRVIPNGIAPLERLRLTPDVRRLAEGWRVLERDLVLLHPTRLLRRKNVEASLHIAASLATAGDPLLLITGAADPHYAPSAEYARELRLLRAEWQMEKHACFVSDHFEPTAADVDSLYTLADALLYPSHQEGFGLPILEAALHRLPIFCRDLEPLTSLLPAGAVTTFGSAASSAQIADDIRRQLEASRTICNRKAVLRTHAWPAVYQKYLAPLLAGAETIFQP